MTPEAVHSVLHGFDEEAARRQSKRVVPVGTPAWSGRRIGVAEWRLPSTTHDMALGGPDALAERFTAVG